MSLKRAVEVATAAPARLIGTPWGRLGTLSAGAAADVVVVRADEEWQVQPEALRSQGKHTPFAGHALLGRVRATLVGGQVVHEAAALTA